MRIFFCIVTLWLATWSAHADGPILRSPDCQNKIACARSSVVSVLPVRPGNSPRGKEPEGSGVIVGDGRLIATADHVIGAARKVLVRTISGQVYNAEVVLRDAQTDVALLRISVPLDPIDFAKDSPVGGNACALGNSFGLDVSVTCGTISAVQMSGVGFNQIEDFVQTDAAVNPGMSGGALINLEGELVGMLSAIFTKESDSNIGVNFAVSAPLLSRVVEDYLDNGALDRIASGILVRPALKSGEVGIAGALVARVKDGSAEESSGIMQGDIILFAGDRRIKRAGAYAAALALLKKGSSLELEILRREKREKITVAFDR